MRRWPATVAVLLATTAVFVLARGPRAQAPPEPVRYHGDAEAMERVALAVTRAILREDAVSARAELDRMAELARPLGPDDKASYGTEVMAGDRSLQITLTNAREYATSGDLTELFNEFVWVQRSCMHCHQTARGKSTAAPAASAASPPPTPPPR